MSSVQHLMLMKEFVFSMSQSAILMHFWYWPTKTILKKRRRKGRVLMKEAFSQYCGHFETLTEELKQLQAFVS